jgi:hypothetical protein
MTTTWLKSIAARVLQVRLAALFTLQALQKRPRFQRQGSFILLTTLK